MTLPATDSFSGTDGQALTSYSSNWSLNSGNFEIQSGSFRSNASSVQTCARWNADTFIANQYAQVKIVSAAGECYAGVSVRCDTSGAATYYVYYASAAGQYLSKFINGTGTALTNDSTVIPDGSNIGLGVTGSTIETFGYSPFGPQTDSSIASGVPGIGGYNAGGGYRGDDFYADNFGPTVNYDTAVESERTGTTDPHTWTHTPISNPNGIVVCVVHGTSTTDHVQTITYGGVSMTRVVTVADTAGEPGRADIWFLGSSIPTGNQVVSANLATATTDDIHFVSISLYTDDGKDIEVVDSDSQSGDIANPSLTLQYTGREGIAIGAFYGGGSAPTAFTPNANCQTVHDFDLGAFYSEVIRQTTVGTSDFAIGGTAALDDVAFVAAVFAKKTGQTVAIGQVSEADSPQAFTRLKTKAIGQNAEADSVFSIRRAIVRAINQTSEADSTAGFTHSKAKALGQVLETDLSQIFTKAKRRAFGLTSELDSVFAVAHRFSRILGQPAETDSTFTLIRRKSKTFGQVFELDTAQPQGRIKIRLFGQASEIDSAFTVIRPAAGVIGQCLESDSVLGITKRKARSFGQCLEADAVFPVSISTAKIISQVQESDSVFALGKRKLKAFGQCLEADSARTIVRGGIVKAFSFASEIDSIFVLARLKAKGFNQALESDVAQIVSRRIVGLLGIPIEVDSATAFSIPRVRLIALMQELDLALALIQGAPDLPGLEYAIRPLRLHYTSAAVEHILYRVLPALELHYTMPEAETEFATTGRELEYTSAEED